MLDSEKKDSEEGNIPWTRWLKKWVVMVWDRKGSNSNKNKNFKPINFSISKCLKNILIWTPCLKTRPPQTGPVPPAKPFKIIYMNRKSENLEKVIFLHRKEWLVYLLKFILNKRFVDLKYIPCAHQHDFEMPWGWG